MPRGITAQTYDERGGIEGSITLALLTRVEKERQ